MYNFLDGLAEGIKSITPKNTPFRHVRHVRKEVRDGRVYEVTYHATKGYRRNLIIGEKPT